MLLQGDRSLAAWLLAAAVVVYLLTFWLLTSVGSAWASLAYSGVVSNLGLALLGTTPPESHRARAQEATAA
jgi:fatty acid desaturase